MSATLFNEFKSIYSEMQNVEGLYTAVNTALDGIPVRNAMGLAEMNIIHLEKVGRLVDILIKMSGDGSQSPTELAQILMRGTYL